MTRKGQPWPEHDLCGQGVPGTEPELGFCLMNEQDAIVILSIFLGAFFPFV